MRSLLPFVLFLLFVSFLRAEPDFPLTEDSKPQPNVLKGTMIKDTYTAKEGSVFPGTQREYQIYLPAGHDKSKPAAFMVFQDGVIYQAPVVFDNLIAKKDIPPLVGIFIKPGVVPAANDNALPRFNRSYEYDSITPTYSQFLIDEFLPAIEAKHGLQLSTDPNHAAIAGNSSGGICAFMVAWHRPDRFRRVFTGVGTYVGIHGADQLPVLVRKFEPKPLRVFLQSGTGDNNLYCGDWWMANQMMERSLTWAGYDVNHAWGEGGHNQKHASQIFPDVLRWLWRDWQTNIEIKANPKGESKWRGYEVVGDGGWEEIVLPGIKHELLYNLTSNHQGQVFAPDQITLAYVNDLPDTHSAVLKVEGSVASIFISKINFPLGGAFDSTGSFKISATSETSGKQAICTFDSEGKLIDDEISLKSVMHGSEHLEPQRICLAGNGWTYCTTRSRGPLAILSPEGKTTPIWLGPIRILNANERMLIGDPPTAVALSPDQTQLYLTGGSFSQYVTCFTINQDNSLEHVQRYCQLEREWNTPTGRVDAIGLCVDTKGWLYVATALGIQVCDQAGRVNFIIPTPKQPYDVCFGGKDLSELFIACGDTIYKRATKAKGVVSGQQPPIKPPPPKL